MENTTMLSRSGRTDPDGKLSSRVDVPMSERLESQIITKAEWIRRTCDKELNGSFAMLKRMAHSAGLFNGTNDGSTSDGDPE